MNTKRAPVLPVPRDDYDESYSSGSDEDPPPHPTTGKQSQMPTKSAEDLKQTLLVPLKTVVKKPPVKKTAPTRNRGSINSKKKLLQAIVDFLDSRECGARKTWPQLSIRIDI